MVVCVWIQLRPDCGHVKRTSFTLDWDQFVLLSITVLDGGVVFSGGGERFATGQRIRQWINSNGPSSQEEKKEEGGEDEKKMRNKQKKWRRSPEVGITV